MKDKKVVRSHDINIDKEYAQWIAELKDRYRSAQAKAAVRINAEQLVFNWELGRDLVLKKAEQRWGTGVVEQVSLDLQAAFPESKGFSAPNLWFMKKWYLFYTTSAAQEKLHQLGRENEDVKLYQAGREFEFPTIFALVPWRHHVEIITKSKSIDEALFYIQHTIDRGRPHQDPDAEPHHWTAHLQQQGRDRSALCLPRLTDAHKRGLV